MSSASATSTPASDPAHGESLDPTLDPDRTASAAAAMIAARLAGPDGQAVTHDVAVVLGSGWGPAAAAIGDTQASVPMGEVPGFSAPSAAGHSGTIASVLVGGRRVLLLQGRIHGYEGNTPARVVHPIRTAAAAGVRTVILTNAAGGLRDDMRVGQPVVIADHLNLTSTTPLVGPQFVDMVDAYSPRLRDTVRAVRPDLAEGVYAGLRGPQYETPAEIRMLRAVGADLVGMSTVHETIAARAAGLEVLGLSLVTNLAAGMTGAPLDHGEVLDAGRAAAQEMGALIASVVDAL